MRTIRRWRSTRTASAADDFVLARGMELLTIERAADAPCDAAAQDRPVLGDLPRPALDVGVLRDEVLHVERAAAVAERAVAHGAETGVLQVQHRSWLVVEPVALREADALTGE